MPSVSLEKVVKSFGPIDVVHGIDLNVEEKEFVVLVGPSGCGKSTTLRMIAGLEEISSGDLTIDGKRMNRVAPKDRDVAMVFQNYALYPHLNVAENMAFGLRIRREPKPKIEASIKEVGDILGLTQYLERRPARSVRRTASAGRDGPRDRAPAEGLSVRRTAVQPRRQTAHPDARRNQAPAQAAGRDQHLRDPRPGRGDDAGRPDRGHARRQNRADRHANGAVPEPRQRLCGGLHRLASDESDPRPGGCGRDRTGCGIRRSKPSRWPHCPICRTATGAK